jgi:uncharacterized protein involved in response to NO
LTASKPEIVAYTLVITAAVLRVFGPLLFGTLTSVWYVVAAAAWSSAFVIYLVIYTPWLVFSAPPTIAAPLPGR